MDGALAGPRIRRAEAADLAGLHALAADTFPLACPPGTTREDADAFIAEHLSVAAFTRYLADPERVVLVAEAAEAAGLVGYTMLVLADPTDPDVAAVVAVRPTAELSKCYVRPEAHGSGVAAALVSATVAEAAGRGRASVWLGVNQQNARANRFYERQGFDRVGTKRFRVGAELHDDFVRMRRLTERAEHPVPAEALDAAHDGSRSR